MVKPWNLLKDLFHNHGLWNLVRVLGTEKMHGSGLFPLNHCWIQGQQASFRANFAHHWRTLLNPGEATRDHKEDDHLLANGVSKTKTSGFHGRKQQKSGQFQGDVWRLLRPRVFVKHLSDFGLCWPQTQLKIIAR